MTSKGKRAARRRGVGVRRRLRALATIGYTPHAIYVATGVPQWAVRLMQDTDEYLLSSAAEQRVVAAYDRLSARRWVGFGADYTAREAHAAGWAPPAAWDDIDNPDEAPQGVPCRADGCYRPQRPGSRGLCYAHYYGVAPVKKLDPADVAHFVGMGQSDEEIAARFGVHPGSVERCRYRHGITRPQQTSKEQES